MLFETFFNNLMHQNNTGGVSFYSAPFENIKSHDFAESANANNISSSFSEYASGKSGLAALIPVQSDIKASQVAASQMIESRFTDCIYRQMERMMDHIFSAMNLKFCWQFKMFGTVFNEAEIRKNARSDFELGDTSAVFTLAALNGDSWMDKLSMIRTINSSGLMDELRIPQTAYTQSGGNAEGGRPSKSIEDIVSGDASESLENQIDAYGEKGD